MTKKLALTRVEPTDTVTVVGQWGRLDLPQHVRSEGAEKLRVERYRSGLTLRQASRRLGISLIEYSDLEAGRATTDWELARELMARVLVADARLAMVDAGLLKRPKGAK